jgi:chromosome segregation ATPase
LKLKVLNENFVDFFKSIAKKTGLTEEDIDSIFKFQKVKSRRARPSLFRLTVEEGRPIDVKQKGPVIEVLGDNQVGKTTTLLYIANLLGYDFYNEDNIEFLGDENLVKQGQEIFSKLVNGMKARLEIIARPYKLTVWTEDGWIKMEVRKGSEIIYYNPFELSTMSTAFRNSVRPYIDVQFISKGRNFDRQLLMDISIEMKWYVERLRERAADLMNKLRGVTDELMKKASLAEGVDLTARKREVQSELERLGSEIKGYTAEVSQIKLKLEAAGKLLNRLPDAEKTKGFKLFRRVHQLKTSISRSIERLNMFERAREKLKEINRAITAQEAQLQAFESELSKKRKIHDMTENHFIQAISAIEGKMDEFLDKENAFRILRILREREIDLLIQEREETEPEAGKAIEDLYNTVMKYNPTIKITEELGGTIAALQKKVENARKIILDHNLVKSITDQLYEVLQDNQLLSSESYQSLVSDIKELGIKVSGARATLDRLNNMRREVDIGQDKKLLAKTNREIEIAKKELRRLQQQVNRLKKKEKDTLTELEKIASVLNPDDPKSVVYTAEWADNLLSLRKELEQQLAEKDETLKVLERQIEELEQENRTIINLLSSPEFEEFSRRMDNLDEFMGILQTLNDVLENWRYLIERDQAIDQFLLLSRHDVTSTLDEVINETFLERCRDYFRMANETKFEIEPITKFDYTKRVFICNKHKEKIASLSGGTASVMTVLSLASKTTSAEFGTVLLVDEFHDVAETLRFETYKRLQENSSLSFSFFARPLSKSPLITRTVDVGVQ